ncbi:hypothetical protein [Pseudomonas nitroreducens]|uniref:hypothetical protein n=1 Tax=Pseudomonas nitroreducens TaxID=46680 RepID=UPI0020A1748C|nr:hypothetical protein [Pseudomonas nitroreducens]MCP1625259.1 hypothetical protein [Pseudomonas nitroreducens]
MKNLKTFVTAVAFSLAGVAVHANAASEASCTHGAACFQLTPLAEKGVAPQLAEDGFSRTPLGMRVNSEAPAQQTLASDGFSRTPLGMRVNAQEPAKQTLASDGFSRTPLGMRVNAQEPAQQTLAADGFGRTPLGKRVAASQDSAVA